MKLDVEQIQQLMRALAENGLSECKIETEGFSLKLVREAPPVAPPPAAPAAVPVPVAAVSAPAAAPVAPAPAAQPSGKVVSAPIVGTFYAQESPDASPYVRVGDRVHVGDVLFIIESMKLMNEVTSEFDGVVAEVLVQNGEPVEYGQPIMRIE